ncbi:MAG: sulfatase-like hydrolase/transferase [Planctomycetaceae bacterium]|nr:sulfatase-like hydrolase/transferase [Planctomycetaceae bacterium]
MKGFRVSHRLLMFLWLAPAAPAVCSADRPPNVLFILSDDQGWADLGCYGATDIQTPHLDALAARGLRMTQFYAAAPVCSPSRAAILTGKVPQRAGMPGNATADRGKPGMPTEQVTLAEVFKAAGYATGHVGKWHLGYSPETMPNGQGFDHSFGHMSGCIDNYSHYFYWAGPNRHDLWLNGKEIWRDGRFFPDLMAAECSQFLERHREGPFFLYWAINVPHYPYQGAERWRKEYASLPEPRRLYATFVSTMDERIGQVLVRLDELGLRENTIIAFQSDHGFSTEERAHFGGGSAGPYRGAKFSLFEGGIRVPAIVSAPGRFPTGETRDQLGTGCDWLPTLCDLAGVDPLQERLDGKSLVAVLRENAASPHEGFHWMTGPAQNPQWAVREGDWKLLGNPKDTVSPGSLGPQDNLFFVNLTEDPSEQKNVSGRHPEIVRRLEKLHEESTRSLD